MHQREINITRFRELLTKSRTLESKNIEPILAWLRECRREVKFTSRLISLDKAQNWSREKKTGNLRHESGSFFSVEGVHTEGETGLREVISWEQPIFNQIDGGILALICCSFSEQVYFLLCAKAEPGNIGKLQLAPSVQCTWSNIKQFHKGQRPPLVEYVLGEVPVQYVYKSSHNEEGGRFWKKSNQNLLILIDEEEAEKIDLRANFKWVTLSQIKELCLVDNVLSPFVKTIIAPL